VTEGHRVVSATYEWVDGVIVETITESEPIPEPVPVVPESVTKFRFWLAWYGATGMTNRDVEAAILTWEPSPQRAQALIALDSARDYRRDNAFVEMLRVNAEMTHEQMDQVFIAAESLEVD